ncbi:MAG TPA: hypothetical protein VE967_16545 [Gemmatimonadaceae bacterium]|nr:hypothetical protein [Gemmatimonadaceae bacterium]
MRVVRCAAVAALLSAVSLSARAQGNYEVQVYASPTVAPHTTMFELHSNYTAQGSKGLSPLGEYGTNHAVHETVEITHGFTSWFETGIYFFTSEQTGTGVNYVGSHIRPRVAVPESWKWPVGLSLSMEMGFQRAAFSADTWTWEIRPIIDKTFDKLYVGLNPVLSRAWKGPGTANGVEFEPNVKFGYDFSKVVNAGIEYYGAMGKIGDFAPVKQQEHMIFAAADLDVSPKWELNFGVGVGATTPTDHLLFKMILGRRVNW